MKIKIIFICFITTLLGGVVNAQDSFSATEFIQGTYMGTTMPLRDFPTTEYDATSPKTMTIIENKFQINEKVNQNSLPYNDINTNVQDKVGGIFSYAFRTKFCWF